jgi:hypothetical protein
MKKVLLERILFMTINYARPAEFRSVKGLINRLDANRDNERDLLISIDELDLPSWQRKIVWTPVQMGLLIYSILRGFPIGMMVLCHNSDDIRVPLDGRQ